MRPSLIVAAALVAACASAGPPPGGPEDRLPPRVVRVTPDTNAVNVRDRVEWARALIREARPTSAAERSALVMAKA